MPQAAIWVSSYCSGIAHDQAKARKFATIALDDLNWTYRKRTEAWLNAPQPSTQPSSPFDEGELEKRKALSRVKWWEQRKADAAAGKALGPYSEELSAAAVGVYVKAFAPQDAANALRQIMKDYPDSPLSESAKTRLAKPADPSKP